MGRPSFEDMDNGEMIVSVDECDCQDLTDWISNG